jgi:serine protease Do
MFIEIILHNIFKKNAICFSDIGGKFQKNSKDISSFLDMNENKGIIVNLVDKGGFLERLGVKEEDVILALDDRYIDRHGLFLDKEHYHRKNIFDAFKLIPIGNEAQLTIWRGGKELVIRGPTVPSPIKKIVSRPIIKERKFIEIWGMTIQILSYDIFEGFNIIDDYVFYQLLQHYDEFKERLVVTYIEKESSSYQQNWSIGEVLKTINSINIDSMLQLIQMLQDGSSVYKVSSESGVIGIFYSNDLKSKIKLKNPSFFLK